MASNLWPAGGVSRECSLDSTQLPSWPQCSEWLLAALGIDLEWESQVVDSHLFRDPGRQDSATGTRCTGRSLCLLRRPAVILTQFLDGRCYAAASTCVQHEQIGMTQIFGNGKLRSRNARFFLLRGLDSWIVYTCNLSGISEIALRYYHKWMVPPPWYHHVAAQLLPIYHPSHHPSSLVFHLSPYICTIYIYISHIITSYSHDIIHSHSCGKPNSMP